jgi:hypothetical protein
MNPGSRPALLEHMHQQAGRGGLAVRAGDDEWSSAASGRGGQGPRVATAEEDGAPVRTWLPHGEAYRHCPRSPDREAAAGSLRRSLRGRDAHLRQPGAHRRICRFIRSIDPVSGLLQKPGQRSHACAANSDQKNATELVGLGWEAVRKCGVRRQGNWRVFHRSYRSDSECLATASGHGGRGVRGDLRCR